MKFPWVCLLLFAVTAHAVEPNEQLKDPALESRARALSSGLRCLVCQNETIDESNAKLAHDIRVFLRERLTNGDSDAAAVQAIVDRYGDFVLLNPPVKPATYVLWFGPLAILCAGIGGAILWMRRRGTAPEAPPPLTEAETARLNSLMNETEA